MLMGFLGAQGKFANGHIHFTASPWVVKRFLDAGFVPSVTGTKIERTGFSGDFRADPSQPVDRDLGSASAAILAPERRKLGCTLANNVSTQATEPIAATNGHELGAPLPIRQPGGQQRIQHRLGETIQVTRALRLRPRPSNLVILSQP